MIKKPAERITSITTGSSTSDSWSDPEAYDAKARDLAARFHGNFEQFESDVSDEVKEAGPKRF